MDMRVKLATEIANQLDLQEAAKSKLQEILQGYVVSDNTANIGNFNLQIKHFLGAKKIEGRSQKTLANYERYLRKLSAQTPKNVSKVTANDIRNFVADLHIKDNSVQTILNIFRSFFSWLLREEIIKKNPMNKIPAINVTKKALRKALSSEDLETVRNACSAPREKALLEFLYSTGCRLSEVVGLQLSQIDMFKRSATVIGKGKKERVVYFSIKAKLYLQNYLLTRPGTGTALFTSTRQPCNALGARRIQKIIKSIGKRAQLDLDLYPHLLRHTFATMGLNNGMDITIIQYLLGHSNLSTTQIYATISPQNVMYEYDKRIA